MLMILAIFSIFFGFITKDMFIGLGSGFFSDNALFIHPSHEIMLDTEFGVPTLFKLLPLIFTISLSVIAIVLSEYLSTILIYFKLSRVGYNIFSFFNQRFLIELFYNRYITGIILKLGGQTTKVIDKGSVEYLGPYGLEKGLLNISNNIARLNTGVITSYALYILIGLIFYLLFNSYINNSIITLALLISLPLVLSQNSNSITPSTVILQSSALLHTALDALDTVCNSVQSGQDLLDTAKALSTTPQQVADNIVNVAQNTQTQITQSYQNVDTIAAAERVSASTETLSKINTVCDSADQLYHDGIQYLREAVDTAKELLDDE